MSFMRRRRGDGRDLREKVGVVGEVGDEVVEGEEEAEAGTGVSVTSMTTSTTVLLSILVMSWCGRANGVTAGIVVEGLKGPIIADIAT